MEQVGTQYNRGVPASVYSRTRNLAVVTVLVVLTWSQAAPSDPTILFGSHTSASSGPLCRKPWRFLPSPWKQLTLLCCHKEPATCSFCALVGSHTGGAQSDNLEDTHSRLLVLFPCPFQNLDWE